MAANAPDVDVLSYARGEYFALAFRRGITHGWPALIVLPFLVCGGVLLWDRLVRRRRDPGAEPVRAGPTLALSALGVLTHPTLDWMNTYGMRWGLPFDGSWSYGDALFIVDPWIWLALGGAVVVTTRPRRGAAIAWGTVALVALLLVRWAGGTAAALLFAAGLAATGAVWRTGPRPERWARALLAGVILYTVALVGTDGLARRHVRAAAGAAGLEVADLMVAPLPTNPFRYEVEVLTSDRIVPGAYALLGHDRVTLGVEDAVLLRSTPPGMSEERAAEIERIARARAPARDWLVWSRYPYVRIEPEVGGWRVRFGDARYDGRPEAAGLAGVSVQVTEEEVAP